MNDELGLYKEMYLKMVRASEEALNILIKAQQECENVYIKYGCSDGEEEKKLFSIWVCKAYLRGGTEAVPQLVKKVL